MECKGFTQNFVEQFNRESQQITNCFCREDVEEYLRTYLHSRPDAREFRKRDLETICAYTKLDIDALLKDKRELLKVRTRKELQDELLAMLYNLYKVIPLPSSYMERTVRALAPEFSQDTVRTAILKKFLLGGGYRWKTMPTKPVLELAEEGMTEEERREYDRASDGEKLLILIDKLDDSAFTEERLSGGMGAEALLRLIIRKFDAFRESYCFEDGDGKPVELSDIAAEEKTAAMLKELSAEAGALVSEGSRTVDILRALDGTVRETERLQEAVKLLDKDFSKQLNSMFYTGKDGKHHKAGELYNSAKRDARRQKKDWIILKLCSDLAEGNFRTNGQTRVYLYYFAIMFGLTVRLSQDEQASDRDIEKLLFEDYYNDNLVRYLSRDLSGGKSDSGLEREPTGEGINFKNYAEVIYLYYLYRTELNLTPGERIDRAEKMIRRCRTVGREKSADDRKKAERLLTENFRSYFANDIIMARDGIEPLSEKEFEKYIVDNYDFSGGGADILAANAENTAFSLFEEIMEENEELANSGEQYQSVYDENYSDDLAQHRIELRESRNAFSREIIRLLKEKYAEDGAFIRIIDNLNERIAEDVNWISMREKKFLLRLLRELYLNSDENSPIKTRKLEALMKKREISVNGKMIKNGVNALKAMGFSAECAEAGSGNGYEYYICREKYGDERLNKLISLMCGGYVSGNRLEKASDLLDQLIEERLYNGKRITRTSFVIAYAEHYLAEAGVMDYRGTLPELLDDFASVIDPYLKKSRFQTLRVRNFLDVFAVLAIYFNLVNDEKEVTTKVRIK